ncbi:MAG TPA: outer membrane beta-barrel protein [Flavipsychrobacter sp.]|nr:outer membrane beta-barrel protein [Flavipsychrobacter sp.]
MKKMLLSLIAIGTIATAQAQRGSILLYGEGYYTSDNQDNGSAKTTSWGVSPGIGYQFNEHMTVGVQGSFAQSKYPYPNVFVLANALAFNLSNYTTNDWTAGAFYRYTKYIGNVFFIYGQLDAAYASGNTQSDVFGSGTYTGFQGDIYPGVGAFICKGFALNFSIGGIGYRTINWGNSETVALPLNNMAGTSFGAENENTFKVTLGHQINIGISKNFNCHHAHHGHHEPGEDLRKIDASDKDDE